MSMCVACSRLTAAEREEVCEKLQHGGHHLEDASHAWFQFLTLQQTEYFSVRQASNLPCALPPAATPALKSVPQADFPHHSQLLSHWSLRLKQM